MPTSRFNSLRWMIAVLVSLWLSVQVADVLESHPGLNFSSQTQDDHPYADEPFSEDAEQERGDSDESDEEERKDAKTAGRWSQELGLHGGAIQRICSEDIPLPLVGLGLPPTPPPEIG